MLSKTVLSVMAALMFFGLSISSASADNVQALLQRARQGDIKVQFYLGDVYANGIGVKRNPVQAAYWYRQAAEKGNPGAQ